MRRFLMMGVAAAVLCLPAGEAAIAKSKPEIKRLDDLKAHPVDYSTFAKRRADIAKENGPGAVGPLALGLAGPGDIGNNPVIDDPKLKAAVRAMLDKLTPPGIQLPEVQIVLVDDLGIFSRLKLIPPENAEDTLEELSDKLASDYGANATSGGAMVLKLGTLMATQSPDELNFLLGHELSHLLLDHFKNEDREKAIKEIASLGPIVAGILSRTGAADSAKNTVEASLALSLVNALTARQWDREQEEEADELGIELSVDLGGYAPNGADLVMKKLEDQEQQQEEGLDRLCGKGGIFTNAVKDLGGGLLNRLTGMNVKVPQDGTNPGAAVCKARHDIFLALMDNHPPAKDRHENLKKHIDLWYADLAKRRVPAPFRDAKGHQVNNFVAFASPDGDANRLAQAYEGLTALRGDDLPRAKRILAGLLSRKEKGEKLAPIYLLQYGIAKKEGRMGEALQALDAATKTAQVYLPAFELLAQEYETAKRWTEAAETVARWRKKAGDNTLYPRLIADWHAAHDKAKLKKALDDCHADAPELAELCDANAADDPDHDHGGDRDRDHDHDKDHDKDRDKSILDKTPLGDLFH